MDLLMYCDTTTLGLLAMSLVTLRLTAQMVYDKWKYSAPTELFDEAFLLVPQETVRILDALKINKKPTRVDLEALNLAKLKQLVSEANAALLHASGNCALLSRVVMHNLLNPKGTALAVKNTYPLETGVDTDEASRLVLSQKLEKTHDRVSDLDELEAQLLKAFHEHGEQVFVIEAEGYTLPVVGETGHCFNAVVYVDEGGEAKVQFIDAWKTSNHLPSKEELRSKYSGKNPTFSTYHCPDKTVLQFTPEDESQESPVIDYKTRLAKILDEDTDQTSKRIFSPKDRGGFFS